MERNLSSNMEDYLETIYVIKKKNGVVRVRDISSMMNVKAPSVTSALNVLSKKGLLIHGKYGYVDLTSKGERVASKVLERHNAILKFLTEILDIDPTTAKKDACGMEHSASSKTLEKFVKFVKFVETCPEDDRPDWLKSFYYYFKTGKRPRCKIKKLKREISREGEICRN